MERRRRGYLLSGNSLVHSVDVEIKYPLDGKEISANDLAGKSGKVKIRFDYENNSKKTVDINGKSTL